MSEYDAFFANATNTAKEGATSLKKTYWLLDEDNVAPEPNQAKFGMAAASELTEVLEKAKRDLGVTETLFNTDIVTFNNTPVRYYIDDTIMAFTWKQVFDYCVYTISEVKIMHPSQIRRYFAGGDYNYGGRYRTTDLAASANAVVASSGDFCKFRGLGIVVYNGKLHRMEGRYLDTCFIDDKGDLLFARQNELTDRETTEKYIEDNNIRHSITFGPVLVKDSEISLPGGYWLGEIYDNYPRAAIAQMGELHYLLITANAEGGNWLVPTIFSFANRVQSFGCKQAYTMDGGQTAVIAMNDELINRVLYGWQRFVSDIVYFATAVPEAAQK
ncbi:MAG: phosphodiester glycosidase family protein [Ruminococcaceae bacterium]|nr:phosphodiester glycosidase family protein [Oscillospiraceae bacterium]